MRLLTWAASLLLFTLLVLHSAPYVARDFIVYQLLQQGADEARLKRVTINWLNAKVTLQGLEAVHDQHSVLKLKRLDFDLYLKELFDQRVRLSGLRVEGLEAQLQQQDQLLLLGPIVLLEAEKSQTAEVSEPLDYEFGSDRIELVDVDLQLLQAEGMQSLSVDRLTVGGVYQWAPLEATDVRFVGHLNGAPISIDSTALPLPERKTLSVQLALRQLELTPLIGAFAPGIAATIDLNLGVELTLEGLQASLAQSGTVRLSNVSVEQGDSAVSLGDLSWSGETSQQLSLQDGGAELVELALNGVLNATQLRLGQGEMAGDASSLELQTNLGYTPTDQSLRGSGVLKIQELTFTQPGQELELGDLMFNLPEIAAGQNTPVSLRAAQIRALGPSAERLSIEQFSSDLSLGQKLGRPVWQPISISGRLVLGDVVASSNQGELDVAQLEAELSSSSLSALERIKLDAVLQQPVATIGNVNAQAENYRLLLDGLVDSQLQRFDGTVEVASNRASVKTAGVDANWETFRFSGPLDTSITADPLAAPLSVSGDLELKQFNLKQDQRELDLEQLSGDLELSQHEQLRIGGKLSLASLTALHADQNLGVKSAQLSPALAFSNVLAQLDPRSVTGALDILLNEATADVDGQQIKLGNLKSNLQLASSRELQSIKGTLSTESIRYSRDQLQLELGQLKSAPELTYDPTGLSLVTPLDLAQLGYSGVGQSAKLEALSAAVSAKMEPDFAIARADVTDLSLNGVRADLDERYSLEQARVTKLSLQQLNSAALEDVVLEQFSAGPQEASIASFSALTLDRATFGDNLLELGTLVLEQLQANLETKLNAEKSEVGANETLEEQTVSSSEISAERRLPIDIKLQSFEARGETRVNYRDSSLASPLSLNLVASKLSAGRWDSRSQQPLAIELRAKLNESADIAIDATISPLKSKPDGEWRAQISALQLPALSPLVETFAGYQIRSGALKLDAKGTMEAGQLKGSNAVQIQRLEVQRGASGAADATDKLFTMPLPSAVSLLETDDRLIKLDLPVTGDISDPKFNYQDVIQIVVTKAVKEGATAYLTNALQPFGAIYMLYNTVKDVNEKGRFIQLQPLEFDLASGELNRGGRDYAAKLGGMMQERPGLTLEICPVTLSSEEQILWDALVKAQEGAEKELTGKALGDEWEQRIAGLASMRIESLRTALIRLGVENERIFPCIARSGATDGAPRVELAF